MKDTMIWQNAVADLADFMGGVALFERLPCGDWCATFHPDRIAKGALSVNVPHIKREPNENLEMYNDRVWIEIKAVVRAERAIRARAVPVHLHLAEI